MHCTKLETSGASYGIDIAMMNTEDDYSQYAMGASLQFSLDMASFTADDLKKALGLQYMPRIADDLKKPISTDCMLEKLELPQPRKVNLIRSLEPVTSEGKFDSPITTPPQLHQPLPSDTIIFFDWDDTLLCTSWLSRHVESQPASMELGKHLRKIAQRSLQMLEMALRMGHTYIITNSVTGWVEYSAAIWVPELLPILRQVQIISARDTYQHLYPNDARQWKLQAFLEVRRQLISVPIQHLLVLGDADSEMGAAQAMETEFPKALIKTVKFQPQPTAKEHLRELDVVVEKFERIVRKPRSLKVVLEKTGTVA